MAQIYVNYNMQCCGLREISNIGGFLTPEAAMEAFCKVIYITDVALKTVHDKVRERARLAGEDSSRFGYFGLQFAAYEALAMGCNMIYMQAYQYSRFRFATFTQATTTDSRPDGKYYGDKLADFITANKLGTVTKTPMGLNPNSGNNVTVFIWAIDHDTLRAWHEARISKTKTINKMAESLLGGLNPWGSTVAPNTTAPAATARGNSIPTPWGYQNILDSAFVQRRQG